ncbi:hypothetical protein BVX99_00990 [bacterium F16]|nr:hypothetical protein BVX99_00990 [bacterium F16]
MAQRASSHYNAETMVSAYINQADEFPVLNPEEEAFHANTFYSCRERLAGWLSRFPRVILPGIQDARVSQIQMLNHKGDPDDNSVDEKRRQIISLVSAIETISEHLAEIAEDSSEQASVTRHALYGSLKKLLSGILLPFDVYATCFADLQECREILQKAGSHETSEFILMPLEEFSSIMTEIETTFAQMEHARTVLLEANLRLIINLSRKYMKYGLSFQDLFQEGYFGMVIALDRFEPLRGHRFTTYAIWWIRQSITNALSSQARTIRLPANLGRLLTRIHRTEQVLLQELGREPTDDEIAARIGQKAERVRAWRKIEQQPISLESTIGGDETNSIHDIIADAGNKQPDEVVSAKMLKYAISEVLETLDERESNIIKHRFGIEGRDLMTLEELSRRYQVSHERIRQIESAALKKLRSSDRRKFFDGYC